MKNVFILYKLLLRLDLPIFLNIPLYIHILHSTSCHHSRGRVIPKLHLQTLIWQNKVSQSGHFKKDIIASIVKTKIMHFSIMINISLQYVYGRVHFSFLFEKILSYKIYIGMTCLQYVYAHV